MLSASIAPGLKVLPKRAMRSTWLGLGFGLGFGFGLGLGLGLALGLG